MYRNLMLVTNWGALLINSGPAALLAVMAMLKRLITAGIGIPIISFFIRSEGGTIFLLVVVTGLLCHEFEVIATAVISKSQVRPAVRSARPSLLCTATSVALVLWTYTQDSVIALRLGAQVAGLAIGAVNLIHVIRAPSSSPSAEDKQQPAAPNLADLLRLLLDLTLLGLISQGICSLVLIRRMGLGVTLAFIGVVWQTDNGALFLGSLCSPHDTIGQLFPSSWRRGLKALSPSKSISGLVGGLLLGTATAALIGSLRPTTLFAAATSLPDRPVWAYAVVGLVLSVLAVAGDLAESFLKRVAGVKDSGSLLPGHGGVLDRMDSMLMAAPFFHAIITTASTEVRR